MRRQGPQRYSCGLQRSHWRREWFQLCNYNAHDMLYTIERAVSFYHDRAEGWDMLVKRAMKADFSWDKSAEEYIRLYEQVLAKEVRT